MSPVRPRVVIVAAQSLQRLALTEMAQQAGAEVLGSLSLERLEGEGFDGVSLWIADAECAEALLGRLPADARVMLGAEPAPPMQDSRQYLAWGRRMQRKLTQWLGTTSMLQPVRTRGWLTDTLLGSRTVMTTVLAGRPASSRLILLGSSTGGVEASKQFLDHLPCTDHCTVIVVQHMDSQMQASLPRLLTRHNAWSAQLLAGQGRLLAENLYILPAGQRVEFLPEARFACGEHPWRGTYRPSLDDAAVQLARQFGPDLLLVALSGMGNDGSGAAGELHRCGSEIWVQSPDSCTSASQPESLLATGHVIYSGTPVELAVKARQWLDGCHNRHDEEIT